MALANDIYTDLVERAGLIGAHPFDAHIAASILALCAAQADECGGSLAGSCGLDEPQLHDLVAAMFPGAALVPGVPVGPSAAEIALRELLWLYAGQASAFQRHLTRMIARRCQQPNHLWQDLGLANRGELGMLMQRHFPTLARRNNADMKWKKFFFRMTCSAAEFTLCAAPVCSECDDFDSCFGSEDGEALLARIANNRLEPAAVRA